MNENIENLSQDTFETRPIDVKRLAGYSTDMGAVEDATGLDPLALANDGIGKKGGDAEEKPGERLNLLRSMMTHEDLLRAIAKEAASAPLRDIAALVAERRGAIGAVLGGIPETDRGSALDTTGYALAQNAAMGVAEHPDPSAADTDADYGTKVATHKAVKLRLLELWHQSIAKKTE
jgi:hypothetical protein